MKHIFDHTIGDQEISFEVRYEDENIWLTQKMMATLYDVDVRTINEHIKKIYNDSELEESSTIRKFRIVQTEGMWINIIIWHNNSNYILYSNIDIICKISYNCIEMRGDCCVI